MLQLQNKSPLSKQNKDLLVHSESRAHSVFTHIFPLSQACSILCHFLQACLCSISRLSQACSMLHLSIVTGLYYDPSLTCHRPVLFCHFLQACSILSLFTGLFYAPSLACHRPVLFSISQLSQACSMIHLSLVTGLFYAPSLTCHRPVLCSISHLSQACSMFHLSPSQSVLHLLPVCRPVSCSISHSVATNSRICHSSSLRTTANVTPCRAYQTFVATFCLWPGYKFEDGCSRLFRIAVAAVSTARLQKPR